MTTDPNEKFLRVCENIASGDTIAAACREAGIGERTFFRALAEDCDGPLGQSYARARRFRADKRASEIEELSRRACLPRDHPEWLDPQAVRVAVDAAKWLAARENNGRFGERLTVEDAAPKKSLSRAEALEHLRAGSIDVDEVLAGWLGHSETPTLPAPTPAQD
ncbi:MAG: hypothetical protein MUE42_03580 [Opitutaceae bacterium]|jgi:hypothetical protein|nr:hypothetical protein [Opitutaceae bacterium]